MNTGTYGRGLEDVLEIQRRFNEMELLIQQQVRLNASEDPFERIQQIARAQAEFGSAFSEFNPDTHVVTTRSLPPWATPTDVIVRRRKRYYLRSLSEWEPRWRRVWRKLSQVFR